MASIGLAGIQFFFPNGDPVVVLVAQRIILPLVCIVEIEKIVPVEGFRLPLALVDADQDILGRVAGPVVNFLLAPLRFHRVQSPIQR